jgi:hypothetical protein
MEPELDWACRVKGTAESNSKNKEMRMLRVDGRMEKPPGSLIADCFRNDCQNFPNE